MCQGIEHRKEHRKLHEQAQQRRKATHVVDKRHARQHRGADYDAQCLWIIGLEEQRRHYRRRKYYAAAAQRRGWGGGVCRCHPSLAARYGDVAPLAENEEGEVGHQQKYHRAVSAARELKYQS